MLPYFIVWAVLAFGALSYSRKLSNELSISLFILLVCFIGFRYQVGGDWYGYFDYIYRYYGQPFALLLLDPEPGYAFFNWLAASFGGSIYIVNILCALVFTTGLLAFCRDQPRPLLALIIAFPYLITVVAMGYSRQGVAIGIEMFALLCLQRDQVVKYLALVILASTFHRPALVLALLPVFTLSGKTQVTNFIRVFLLCAAAYGLYSGSEAEISKYVAGYVGDYAEYSMTGVLIRLGLSFLFSVLFIFNIRAFRLSAHFRRVWLIMSWLAILSLVSITFGLLPTAIDRLALYLLPLQLFVGSRLPDTRLFGLSPVIWNYILISMTLAFLSLWLLFANHSSLWLPYQNALFLF